MRVLQPWQLHNDFLVFVWSNVGVLVFFVALVYCSIDVVAVSFVLVLQLNEAVPKSR